MNKPSKRVSVLGAGSWGATLASLLVENDVPVTLWEFNPSVAAELASSRRLKVMPALELPKELQITPELRVAVEGAQVLVIATPSHFVRATCQAVNKLGPLDPAVLVVSVAKGIEEDSLDCMSAIIEKELNISRERVLAISGPSHAEEVCKRVPTAVVVAGTNQKNRLGIQTLFTRPYFRVYEDADLVGVEMAGAMKNIFAIACGIADGLGLGDNTKAAIMTRGLNEMTRIGLRAGGKMTTFFGLAGMGDLIVTCTSQHSRNRLLGEKIGGGKTPSQALADMVMVAEGHKTTRSTYGLAQRYNLDCPIIRELYEILFNDKKPQVSLQDLLQRETQSEWYALEESAHE